MSIDVTAEAPRRDCASTLECRDRDLRPDELVPQRLKDSDRHAIACHYEALSTVERAHDLAAFVPELPLRDLSCHPLLCNT